jgi:acetoin utilization deacetylase AcuC-like enzyme
MELGQRLSLAADRLCAGHVVSVLEGGYDLAALGASVAAYLKGLSSPSRSASKPKGD